MPRKIVPIVVNEPYHISARCINKEWFELPLQTVWSIMEDYLFILHHGFNVRIHSFVLMSNHFHLIVTPTLPNLSSAMLYFMRETSKEISRLTGRINQTYGNRNHKTWIGNYYYFLNSYKYVYQNPIRAGISSTVQSYPYSTLHGLLGNSKLIVPIDEDLLFQPNLDSTVLNWLNRKVENDHANQIKMALRGPLFELPICRKTMKRSFLEDNLL